MGIRSLGTIIKKDFKIFTRSRISSIIIILAPLLIVLFALTAFNSTNLSNINIGTYSENYTPLTEDILLDLENQNYIIEKYNSKEECINSVKLTDSQICIVFPKDLSSTGSIEEVIFHVDYSRINLAYTLIHEIETKISSEARSLGIVLAQDLINSLNSAKENLTKEKTELSEAIDELNSAKEISSNLNIPTSDLENIINDLEDVRDSMNSSSAKTLLIESINDLESIKNETIDTSLDLENLESKNSKINIKLQEISANLGNVIKILENTNVVGAENIVSPIKIKIESVKLNSNNRDYLTPTLFTLIILFGATLLASTFVLKEKKTKAYFRNFITPTIDFTFIFGTYLTCLFILIFQFVLVFLGMKFILNIDIFSMPLELGIILFLTISTFIFIGMFIGYLFRSEETIIFGSVLITAILMFFSNVILPIENISGSLKNIALFNPVVVSDIALKKILLFNFDYTSLLSEIYILGSFIIAFAVLTYFARKITKRML